MGVISMRLMLFSHLGLCCRDPQQTEEFYTKHFGFHRARVVGNGADEVVFLKMEYCPTMLELFQAQGESPAPPATGAGPEYPGVRHLAFQVDDVDALLAEIGDDAVVTQPPLDFGDFIPGWRTAWIADPDGRIVEVSQGYFDDPAGAQVLSAEATGV
ncbi:MAG: VOC family protein [Pirellulales bacterium]|nr:VOC family protein [Pirellulales bacterium]